MGRLGLELGLGLVLVLRLGLGFALGLHLGIGIGFRRNHSWSSTFTPRRNYSLCLSKFTNVQTIKDDNNQKAVMLYVWKGNRGK